MTTEETLPPAASTAGGVFLVEHAAPRHFGLTGASRNFLSWRAVFLLKRYPIYLIEPERQPS
jgi:hypothetical protein